MDIQGKLVSKFNNDPYKCVQVDKAVFDQYSTMTLLKCVQVDKAVFDQYY